MLKPKKNRLYVPSYGVINKEDFNEEHVVALKIYAEEKGFDFSKKILPQLEGKD